MWWSGGDRLCQTRPIPRSPDGDKNKCICLQLMMFEKRKMIPANQVFVAIS